VPGLHAADTDDAYITADMVAEVPKVPAHVPALHATDNSTFTAGQLLGKINPRGLQVALETAAANLHSTEAARQTTVDQVREQGDIRSDARREGAARKFVRSCAKTHFCATATSR
jgi:membrane fusion protein, multidrug efflux system